MENECKEQSMDCENDLNRKESAIKRCENNDLNLKIDIKEWFRDLGILWYWPGMDISYGMHLVYEFIIEYNNMLSVNEDMPLELTHDLPIDERKVPDLRVLARRQLYGNDVQLLSANDLKTIDAFIEKQDEEESDSEATDSDSGDSLDQIVIDMPSPDNKKLAIGRFYDYLVKNKFKNYHKFY